MKKVKIMLMSLAVLALVGGALAFKVSKFQQSYCSILAKFDAAPPAGSPSYYCPDDSRWTGSKVCADLANVTIVDPGTIPPVVSTTNVCTTTVNGIACGNHQDCNTNTTVFRDN